MAQRLSDLPIGAKVKFGKYSVRGSTAQPITWIVVAKNHISSPAYPTNSVTLMTEKIIDSLAMDASEPQHADAGVRVSGNSDYIYSNLDQWLNKDAPAGNWYTPTHSADQSPNVGRDYFNRPAFLNAFSIDEKNIILNTIIRCIRGDGGKINDVERKVFLASHTEINEPGAPFVEGSAFDYFKSASRVCAMSEQLRNDTSVYDWSSAQMWSTRTPHTLSQTYIVAGDNNMGKGSTNYPFGIRPVLNVPSSSRISDTTDGEGYYTFVFNSAPLSPTIIYTPNAIYGGKSNSISWNKAVDVDGDTLAYQLECSIDGGEYAQIYDGTSLTYAHLVPYGSSTVIYRIKATDPAGESSAYTTSDTINVVNNNAPVISGVDGNLGVMSDDFTGTYTITDANSDIVTVTEAIDGVQIRSLVATLGQAITYGVTENTWLALPNGSHTLTISATDGIDTTVRTYVFTKLVDTLKIQNSTPWVASTMPSRIMLVITRNIPSAATFKVEVCNNGYDASPTWEDCTDAVRSGLVHVFSNTEKTATDWGVLVRVTVARNGATGACYISAIGGNFE